VNEQPTNSHFFGDISQGSGTDVFDVLGPTVEFLTSNHEYCVMRGVIPPGVTVPLHSHDDAEDFFIVSGTQQVLIETDDGTVWVDAPAGDHVRVTGSALHAHRNVSDRPPWISSSPLRAWDGCSVRSAGRSPVRRCR
jgi:mannose-6-phosphate isomerase-like protein (cupin superfamily)